MTIKPNCHDNFQSLIVDKIFTSEKFKKSNKIVSFFKLFKIVVSVELLLNKKEKMLIWFVFWFLDLS